jgi:predicted Rossmann fold flavoprotein
MTESTRPSAAQLTTEPAAAVWPLIVIGAGAAGILTAIFASRGGARTLLLESHAKPGAKIRVSGGGRCNVLPSRMELSDFHTRGSPNTLRNLFASWPLDGVRAFFERDLGLALKVEESGKVFPVSDDADEVVAALFAECSRSGAELRSGVRVRELARIEPAIDGARFELTTESGERLRCARIALCTGGLSLPKTGSDGWGFDAARALGHTVLATYPALVPLLTERGAWHELAGVSLRATVRAMRGDALLEERTGDLLFTHKGFSGPVVLDQSRHVTDEQSGGVVLTVAWLGADAAKWDERLVHGGTRTVVTTLRELLPRRLVTALLELAAVQPERKLAELAREERKRLVRVLAACPLEVSGNEGYRTAEVTGGGIPLEEINAKTLESRLVPGLFLAGEIVDVTGRIGGFNFLWAWVSGRKVGLAVASQAAPAR